MRIALTGNPNSGKTSMFNALTGKSEKVGNWAGVTVDKVEGLIKKSYHNKKEEIIAVDLPGAYSMSPFTSEEGVTSQYVKNEKPDAIINIVDATNLSRSLFFTTQLLELNIPLVVALNKSDINKKKETYIDVNLLSEKLGCPVIETVASSGNKCLKDLVGAALGQIGKTIQSPYTSSENGAKDKEEALEEDRKRFEFVNEIVSSVESRKVLTKESNFQDKIDRVLTNKWLGLPIFAVVMWLVFWVSQVGPGLWISELFSGWITDLGGYVDGLMAESNPFLKTVVVDGVIGGVGAVVGFLPLVMVMYFMLALLEDCGYMARVSVVLDPIFKKVGLSGKSIIPLVVGTGCSVPGIMACRTIRDERERRATAMLTPFVPCGAKIPLIAMFAGAFFPGNPWISPLMYFTGIALVFFGALLVKWVSGYKYKKSFFIIEIPEYKLPGVWKAVVSMFSRGKEYLVKAGTIILLSNSVVTIMSSYSWNLQSVEPEASILRDIASPIAFLLIPLGFGLWQLAAAAITGFIAKEEVVGTIAAVFAVSNSVISEDFELMQSGGGEALFGITASAGLAYLMFNLFSPPCFAAIGAMNSEIKSRKWFFAGLGLQFAVAYVIAFSVYQIGTLITLNRVGEGFAAGLVTVAAIASVIISIGVVSNANAKKEMALRKQKRAVKSAEQ